MKVLLMKYKKNIKLKDSLEFIWFETERHYIGDIINLKFQAEKEDN